MIDWVSQSLIERMGMSKWRDQFDWYIWAMYLNVTGCVHLTRWVRVSWWKRGMIVVNERLRGREGLIFQWLTKRLMWVIYWVRKGLCMGGIWRMGKSSQVGESFTGSFFFNISQGNSSFSAVKFTCCLMLPRWHIFMTIDSIQLGPVGQ